MDWDNFPLEIKERYCKISKIDIGILKIAFLEEMNKQTMDLSPGEDSLSYEIFATEFNGIMLVAHVFENLMIFEDRRLELEGYDDFQLKIPEVYFQHPSLNVNPIISNDNSNKIFEVVDSIKKKLNYSKDQSFVLSQLHKFEFISVFSHLEAYVESLLIEFLAMEKKDAVAKIRRNALPALLTEVFNEIDPRINEAIKIFDDESLKFLGFCHKLRNLHTHKLGIVDDYFYNECMKEGYIVNDTYAETSKPVLDYARLKFKYSDYVIKVGNTINLTVISQPFRLLSREIVFIAEIFCKEKMRE